MRKDSSLAQKNFITREDLIDLPLICSREALNDEYLRWFGKEFDKFNIAITYNLLYNAAIMVREGLGYAISIDNLVDVSDDSEICFRPLYPVLESKLHFIWKKYQLFNPASELFLREMQSQYSSK